ncbi:MAG: 3'-5' exonuclease [Pseudomonadota bacterium]
MGLIRAKLKNRILRARLGGRPLPPLAAANLQVLEGLDPGVPALGCSFVILDLETTGLDPLTDRVVSVGAVRLREGRVRLGDRFGELVNPGRDIPPQAIKVHGIKPDMLTHARHAGLVFQDFLAFLGRDILVAHYAPFDLHFINRTMHGLYGFPLQNLVLDTVLLCQGVILPSDPYGVRERSRQCNLDSLARRYGLPQEGRHTALGDALLTAMVFQRLLGQMDRRGRTSLRLLLSLAARW